MSVKQPFQEFDDALLLAMVIDDLSSETTPRDLNWLASEMGILQQASSEEFKTPLLGSRWNVFRTFFRKRFEHRALRRLSERIEFAMRRGWLMETTSNGQSRYAATKAGREWSIKQFELSGRENAMNEEAAFYRVVEIVEFLDEHGPSQRDELEREFQRRSTPIEDIASEGERALHRGIQASEPERLTLALKRGEEIGWLKFDGLLWHSIAASGEQAHSAR